MNGKKAKRLRKIALQVCRGTEEAGAVYHTEEVTGTDGKKRKVIRAVQAKYRPESFDRVYQDLKRRCG